MIDVDGLHPPPEKMGSIMDRTRPKKQKEMERFNAIVNLIS